MITLTNRQARQFILLRQGLLGEYKFAEKQGVLDFIRQAGCIQFDPIDICGKNAELTLQSRVKNFTKDSLEELLYKNRLLLDHPDKNTSIILTEDWPYFERWRESARRRAHEHPELKELMKQVLEFIKINGAVCPDDINLESDFKWRAFIVWSSGKNLSSSVMEQLYGMGDLIIHHKNGTRKYYDLAKRHIPADVFTQPEPLSDDTEHIKWLYLRRIGAIGFLWSRPTNVMWRMSADRRNEIFRMLENDKAITAVRVEGLKDILYCRTEDVPILETVAGEVEHKPRCELIAPLDPFIWDRKLIKAIFNFEYTWEIYTPVAKRKYGHYVLPMLYGERFIGRVEAVCERKTRTLIVKNIWYEKDVKQTKKLQTAVDGCLKRFAKFNGCNIIEKS